MADALPTSNLAPMFGNYVTDYLGKAQGLADTQFQPYTGDRFADLSPLQQQALSGIGGLSAPTEFGQASGLLGQASQAIGGVNYNPMTYSTTGIGPLLDARDMPTVQSFMNPYTQQVTDIATREAQRAFDIDRANRDAAAVRAGAFGGDRSAIVEAEALRNNAQLLNDIQMKGGQQAYQQAMEALNNQRAAQLDMGKFNADLGLRTQQLQDQSNQFGAGFGLDQARALTGIASGMTDIGTRQLNAQQGILADQLAAGNLQQQQAQQPLDFGYQQWQQSLQFPYQQLQFQRDMLQGLPLSVTNPTPTNPLLEGLMGAGGLYQLLYGGS